MQPVTNADRQRELRSLLDHLAAHPEQASDEQRQRIVVLRQVLARQG